ncbi:hypothetical protein [Paenibacillus aceti]|uniref:DUF4878 domain-containing protein n=1 Tax=Paenibacillus aceti TaxID=1820010 RepID=A0ABQ1W6Z7_9BACL|nr:hypothetical protein [Paenibacillus aceti]GGG16555.1 hypothetical protein GCM10010913_43240 [Paenibacillus aceti]
MRQLYCLLLIIFTAGCSYQNSSSINEITDQKYQVNQTNDSTQSKDHRSEPIEATEEDDSNQEQSRVGELDIKDLKVDGVKGALLDAVKKQLKEAKANNKENIEKLIHPKAEKGNATSFYELTMNIRSINKLELNNERVTAVSEEYDLNENNVKIVTIHMVSLQGTEENLNLIYVFSNNKWLLYRID